MWCIDRKKFPSIFALMNIRQNIMNEVQKARLGCNKGGAYLWQCTTLIAQIRFTLEDFGKRMKQICKYLSHLKEWFLHM